MIVSRSFLIGYSAAWKTGTKEVHNLEPFRGAAIRGFAPPSEPSGVGGSPEPNPSPEPSGRGFLELGDSARATPTTMRARPRQSRQIVLAPAECTSSRDSRRFDFLCCV